MSRNNVFYIKGIVVIFLFTIVSFCYLNQKISLLRENYQEAKLYSDLGRERVRNEEFTYRTANLETPGVLKEKLMLLDPNFSFAKSVKVVKVPYLPKEEKENVEVTGKVSFAGETP
ncbi:MAG TPA: hypothetical protein ENN78_02040 [Candidatus Omnitrophica bacterium]|nr:hypothetical protein [Candidatus Omnitrophota bacterium]